MHLFAQETAETISDELSEMLTTYSLLRKTNPEWQKEVHHKLIAKIRIYSSLNKKQV